MPEALETNYGDNAIFAFLKEAATPCFSPELVRRFLALSEFQPDYLDSHVFGRDSQGQAAHLEIQPYNGQQAYIDNVEGIWHSTTIKAGAQIGPFCMIGTRVTIGEGVELEAATRVENGAVIEHDVVTEAGASFLTGSVTGSSSIIRQCAEVGYDVKLPTETILKEKTFASRDTTDPHSFAVSNK